MSSSVRMANNAFRTVGSVTEPRTALTVQMSWRVAVRVSIAEESSVHLQSKNISIRISLRAIIIGISFALKNDFN